jgi:hypothetical protein
VFSSLAGRTETSSQIQKVIESELEEDGRLYFQLSLAEILHCTLYELKSKVTEEEMQLWACYFSIKSKRQAKDIEKVKRASRR